MCENKLQCIICSDIHMSHNDNSRNVSHTFLIDHNLSGPGRSHAQAAKQHLLLISRPPARWATGFSGDLQHNYLLLYIMFCFCNVCAIVLEINILLLLLQETAFQHWAVIPVYVSGSSISLNLRILNCIHNTRMAFLCKLCVQSPHQGSRAPYQDCSLLSPPYTNKQDPRPFMITHAHSAMGEFDKCGRE